MGSASANARKNYQKLLVKQQDVVELSETSVYNTVVDGVGPTAIIAFGIGYNYAMEVISTYQLNIPVLKISQYPLPKRKLPNLQRNMLIFSSLKKVIPCLRNC